MLARVSLVCRTQRSHRPSRGSPNPCFVPDHTVRVDPSCGNAGRWEEALQLINKLEALAQAGGGLPMSTTLYNFAIDTVRRRALVSAVLPRRWPADGL